MASDSIRERFEEIVMPHLDSVSHMAVVLCGDESLADDLVQETFVRAFRAFPRFELREFGPRPWLLKILQNVFYSNWEKLRRDHLLLDHADLERMEPADDAEASWDGQGGKIEWESMDEEIRVALRALAPEYRSVLLLWALEGFSYREIASVCDCAIGTVMSRLYRARQLMGKSLMEYARVRNLSTERFE